MPVGSKVALKLIIDRENEIKNFIPEEYWSLDAEFQKGRSKKFSASFYGIKNKKMALKNNEAEKTKKTSAFPQYLATGSQP